ncbi:polysaccharide pyruvyl transferase family protein (plasmid) [Tundrisphaera lichenicola]|uniref:polysaccharide pyruvyl transferase family protein n=1 Tax=Tundrisphaera lichenicola TaxID=2029860 RepID=UPI003EBBF0F6
MPKRIAVLGHVGRGNLGDEATLAAVIRQVRLHEPLAEIRALTMNPADTLERHGVPAFPLRRTAGHAPVVPATDQQSAPSGEAGQDWKQDVLNRLKAVPLIVSPLRRLRDAARAVADGVAEMGFLARSSRHLKEIDLLVVAGGGQLGDYFEGVWGYPFTIFKWVLMARARGGRVAFLSVGAGPIDSFLSKRFFRWALSLASYRSFRDEGSKGLIEALGVIGPNHVTPDLVHEIETTGDVLAGRDGVRVVGINPLPFHDPRYWAEDGQDMYRDYVRKLATFAVRLINSGYRIVLFPTQVKADPPVISDVRALIAEALPMSGLDSVTCPRVATIDDLLAAIDQTDLVVASRFHGIVISLAMGRPVIGLSYNPKTDELMADMGLGDFVSDIGGFEVSWLISRVETTRGAYEEIRDRIESRRESYRAALSAQHEKLFGEACETAPCLSAP